MNENVMLMQPIIVTIEMTYFYIAETKFWLHLKKQIAFKEGCF